MSTYTAKKKSYFRSDKEKKKAMVTKVKLEAFDSADSLRQF